MLGCAPGAGRSSPCGEGVASAHGDLQSQDVVLTDRLDTVGHRAKNGIPATEVRPIEDTTEGDRGRSADTGTRLIGTVRGFGPASTPRPHSLVTDVVPRLRDSYVGAAFSPFQGRNVVPGRA